MADGSVCLWFPPDPGQQHCFHKTRLHQNSTQDIGLLPSMSNEPSRSPSALELHTFQSSAPARCPIWPRFQGSQRSHRKCPVALQHTQSSSSPLSDPHKPRGRYYYYSHWTEEKNSLWVCCSFINLASSQMFTLPSI